MRIVSSFSELSQAPQPCGWAYDTRDWWLPSAGASPAGLGVTRAEFAARWRLDTPQKIQPSSTQLQPTTKSARRQSCRCATCCANDVRIASRVRSSPPTRFRSPATRPGDVHDRDASHYAVWSKNSSAVKSQEFHGSIAARILLYTVLRSAARGAGSTIHATGSGLRSRAGPSGKRWDRRRLRFTCGRPSARPAARWRSRERCRGSRSPASCRRRREACPT